MIVYIKESRQLDEMNLNGKYVLRKLYYHWFAFGKVAIVISRNDAMLELEKEETIYCEKRDRKVYTGRGRRSFAGKMPISDVAFVCDTPEEVNAIIQMDVEAEAEFNEMKRRTHDRVLALDGCSFS